MSQPAELSGVRRCAQVRDRPSAPPGGAACCVSCETGCSPMRRSDRVVSERSRCRGAPEHSPGLVLEIEGALFGLPVPRWVQIGTVWPCSPVRRVGCDWSMRRGGSRLLSGAYVSKSGGAQEVRVGRGSAEPATTREQCSTARRRSQPETPLFGKATPTPSAERTPIASTSQLIRPSLRLDYRLPAREATSEPRARSQRKQKRLTFD
jgi:hypothetical protein